MYGYIKECFFFKYVGEMVKWDIFWMFGNID